MENTAKAVPAVSLQVKYICNREQKLILEM